MVKAPWKLLSAGFEVRRPELGAGAVIYYWT